MTAVANVVCKCLASLAPISAAISSRLGRVKVLSGATRFLAITSVEFFPLQMNVAVSYELMLHLRRCAGLSDCHLNFITVFKSFAKFYHDYLARTVTGDSIPRVL